MKLLLIRRGGGGVIYKGRSGRRLGVGRLVGVSLFDLCFIEW